MQCFHTLNTVVILPSRIHTEMPVKLGLPKSLSTLAYIQVLTNLSWRHV